MRRARSGRLAPALLLVVAAGCAVSPTPIRSDGLEGPFQVPDFLRPSITLIDSDPTPAPLLDRSAGEWIRLHVRGVEIDPTLPASVRARCCDEDRIVRWSSGWIPDVDSPDEVRLAAAILLHEARHAEGYRHTCADTRRDRSLAEGGAWAIQAAWLRHMGDVRTAETIETFDIGC